MSIDSPTLTDDYGKSCRVMHRIYVNPDKKEIGSIWICPENSYQIALTPSELKEASFETQWVDGDRIRTTINPDKK